MDQLSSRNEKVLYDLFELASGDESRLVIIGIANGLDLLERVLPDLPKNSKPDQMNFQPYTVSQISTLIKVNMFELEVFHSHDKYSHEKYSYFIDDIISL